MTFAYGTSLEEYDNRRVSSDISSIARFADLEEATGIIEQQAVSNALLVHPVTRFVLSSPVESTMYPAIRESYHGLARDLLGRKARNDRHIRAADLTDSPNMVWSLPGRGSGYASCGVVKPNSDEVQMKPKASKGIPVKMCTSDPKHYIRAVSNHCGSLRCPKCANWTAMQTAIRIEERICTPADIQGRKDGFFDAPKHWAISPPQEWFKGIMQRSDFFSALVDDLCALLPAYGFYAGVLVCHPWRLSEDASEWIFSPHFHAVGYGRFRNMELRHDLAQVDSMAGGIWNDDGKGESWVFNQIHPDEPLRSVRHTLGYILTHAGLGTFDHDVDWTDAADRISIPIESGKGNAEDRAKTIAPYMVQGDAWREYGYYAEHLDELDWLQWTEKQLAGSIPTFRVFGAVHKVRTLSDHKERVPRLCPDCGRPIGLYHGVKSLSYEPVVYNRSSKIRVMRDDLEEVRRAWEQHSEELRAAGLDDLDFAVSVPQCSTPETKGLQDLERLRTPEQLQQQYDRKIAYVPSKYGIGYDPMVLTRRQFEVFRKTGLIPEGAEWNDSVRSESFYDRNRNRSSDRNNDGNRFEGSSSVSSAAKRL